MGNVFKLYVVCKKSKTENIYQSLVADLGYAVKNITFQRDVISEITGVPLRDLSQMELNSKRFVGTLTLAEE